MSGHSVTVVEESKKHASSDITYSVVEEEKYQLSHRLWAFIRFIPPFLIHNVRLTCGAGCN